jgi:fructose-1,6-bisphosphatase II
MQARLVPQSEAERLTAADEGKDLGSVLQLDDLCAGENVFFAATGITDGELLEGVRFAGSTARTQSVVMRSWTGTVRYIDAVHNMTRLRALAASGRARMTPVASELVRASPGRR